MKHSKKDSARGPKPKGASPQATEPRESQKAKDEPRGSQKAKDEPREPQKAERLQKVLVKAGLGSRRQCEAMIREGQVTINGKLAKLGDHATWGADAVKVNGKLLFSQAPEVFMAFYKPKRVIAMMVKDGLGRPSLLNYLGHFKPKVFPVGRMDFNGDGLLLLTNDGRTAEELHQHPLITRRYEVKVSRPPDADQLVSLTKGVVVEGKRVRALAARIKEHFQKNAIIEIAFQGMGAIDVRAFFKARGLLVEAVTRVAIGQIELKGLKPGEYKLLKRAQIESLLQHPELTQKNIDRIKTQSAKELEVMRELTKG